MENKLTYKIDCEGVKLRDYLRVPLKLSSRFIRGASKSGRIYVNGRVVKLSYVLKAGDLLEIDLNKEESQNVLPEDIPIDVAYEDEDIIVVNKPPNMVVHPTKSYPSGTLSNGLINYFRSKNENCIVRLVSRLDMDTSGLIIVAKNQFSHMALARDMSSESFEKSYLAVVHGHFDSDSGTIDLPIYRTGEGSIKRVVDERGQRSITHYEVVQKFKEAELLKLTLETGRTHQIRVHVSHLGHPIYGDTLYGLEGDEKYISRQALHAYRLSFLHPRTGEKIELETELPEDIKKLIGEINNQ